MEIDEMARFSDGQLMQLRQDLDAHIEEYRREMREIAKMVEQNTRATERIAEAVEKQAESTAGIIEVWNNTQGTIAISRGLGKFLAWLSGLGAALAVAAGAITYVIDKFRS
jgi:methyl-accepting chemotaxis protein